MGTSDPLLALAGSDGTPEELLAKAVEVCSELDRSVLAAAYLPSSDGRLIRAAGGSGDFPPNMPLPEGWPDAVTAGWHRVVESRLDVAVVAGEAPVALLAVTGTTDAGLVGRVAALAGTAIGRRTREDALTRSVRHFVAAQRISHVGSYDFEIASNTNDWSDQLYRIYGREPQSFNASYEKFLEMVHPDDREKIIGVHQEALAQLSTYDMEERIIWPDGQLRTLASWGEVVADAAGNPARMVGICWDITEQKTTATALERSMERFERLIQSAPDVVLVTSAAGVILQANDRVEDVLGWDPTTVVGRAVTELVPAGLGPPGGPPRELIACDRDGNELPIEISTSEFDTEEGPVTAAFLRDVRDRKRSEELALRLHDTEVRRRHALEINDNVVQGLASVLYLLDLERHESAHAAARRTMETARAMMADLLEEAGPEGLSPGELVREHGHVSVLEETVPVQPPPRTGALRVVLADDAEDIRLLLRMTLTTTQGFDVVAEAADGEEAVRMAAEHTPDVMLLDLSMPVMDGLQAIPEVLRVSPDTRIVILSGFDETRMQPVALELGAHAYLQKGEAAADIVQTLATLFPDHSVGVRPPRPEDPDDGGLAFDGDMVVHELRTPLTVITGMLGTLRDRMDVLPSATTRELVDAAGRNARQMADLLDAVSDARRATHGQLPVVPEDIDLGGLVRDAVADLCAGHNWPSPTVRVVGEIRASVDPMRVRQVLANLLSNAYKFSPSGTPVTVTVRSVDDLAELTVHDEGPGIPADHRHELFGKFSRLGRSGHGMGLGLYISRAIARAHGGELELRDGSGATFALTLPLRSAARANADQPS
jgi:PAS domain S-box-containing protein